MNDSDYVEEMEFASRDAPQVAEAFERVRDTDRVDWLKTHTHDNIPAHLSLVVRFCDDAAVREILSFGMHTANVSDVKWFVAMSMYRLGVDFVVREIDKLLDWVPSKTSGPLYWIKAFWPAGAAPSSIDQYGRVVERARALGVTVDDQRGIPVP